MQSSTPPRGLLTTTCAVCARRPLGPTCHLDHLLRAAHGANAKCLRLAILRPVTNKSANPANNFAGQCPKPSKHATGPRKPAHVKLVAHWSRQQPEAHDESSKSTHEEQEIL